MKIIFDMNSTLPDESILHRDQEKRSFNFRETFPRKKKGDVFGRLHFPSESIGSQVLGPHGSGNR